MTDCYTSLCDHSKHNNVQASTDKTEITQEIVYTKRKLRDPRSDGPYMELDIAAKRDLADIFSRDANLTVCAWQLLTRSKSMLDVEHD